ncbi:MAG: radical SAM protein [Myxococcales bacterium]
MDWSQIEAVRARLADEQGTLVKDAPVRVALCYPSPYHVGMSSLGFQTIYREIHSHPNATAERAFLPDDVGAFRQARMPLFTYETQTPVSQFPVLAFSVAYELELTGLFEVLELAGLPILARERTDAHPLIVAGGPLTNSNPTTLEPFVDLLIMGEAEETIHTLLERVGSGLGRTALLDSLVGQYGFHVTGRGRPLPGIAKAEDARLPARSQILTPHTELRSMFLIEPERGCSRGCTYCVMRRTTNGGMRRVEPERVLSLIPDHAKRVGLVGAAVTDHPRIADLVRTLVESGREIGISSLRADRLTQEFVHLLAKGGYRTLTTASDGTSQRMREAIDRKTNETHLTNAALYAREAKLSRLKLYEVMSLPNETEEDIEELARFSSELSKIIPVSLGISPFVAKRNTPLDGAPFEPIPQVEAKLHLLKKRVRGRVEIRSTSARWAWVEYMLAQSGPEAGLAALDAWRNGGAFADWKRAFKEHGVKTYPGPVKVPDGRRNLPAIAWRPPAAATAGAAGSPPSAH